MRAWIVLASLGLGACSGPQSALDTAGAQASELLSLLTLMLWVCGIAYAFVLAFLGLSLWRARTVLSRVQPAIDPDDHALGRGLWIWAISVSLGLLLLAGASFWIDGRIARAEDAHALEVRVTGHQWWWRIEYRDPASGTWIETANELHLPQGRTTRVLLGSVDVIHSFWVPNIAGKMDLVPGRMNVIALTPHRLGRFRGQCAEFCGAQHAQMAFDVTVDTPADFTAWLTAQKRPAVAPATPELARGLSIVTEGPCASCHRIRGTKATGRVGPDLTHLAARPTLAAGTLPMSRGAIQGWIAQPRALKPGTMMPPIPLAPADADAVSLYLASLK